MGADGDTWGHRLRTEGRVEFRESRAKAAGLALGALVLVGGGFLMTGVPWLLQGGDLPLRLLPRVVIGWVGVVFFGLGLVVALRILVNPRTAFTVTTEGLTLGRAPDVVPWDRMTDVTDARRSRDRFVRVGVDAEEYARLVAPSRIARALSGTAQAATGGPAIRLPTTARYDRKRLAAWLQEELEARRTRDRRSSGRPG